jgi:formylmethanofuran dehydrogenase subunit E
MKDFEEYVALAEQAHGHICAGQILGLRLALYGLALLGIEDPTGRDRKRLITFVEIDRCATDAVSVVTGCRMGKRALKFRDFGKVAATFVDLAGDRAVRVAARDSSKRLAAERFPEIADRNQQQMKAYRMLTDEELFTYQWVKVKLAPQDLPGWKGEKVVCSECGETVNFGRQIVRGGRALCKACAGDTYYLVLEKGTPPGGRKR